MYIKAGIWDSRKMLPINQFAGQEFDTDIENRHVDTWGRGGWGKMRELALTYIHLGFPGGSDSRAFIHLQCRRSGFDPWVGKIPGEGKGNTFQYSCRENSMDRGGC